MDARPDPSPFSSARRVKLSFSCFLNASWVFTVSPLTPMTSTSRSVNDFMSSRKPQACFVQPPVKAAGKKVFAYCEDPGTKEYLLGLTADVFAIPEGGAPGHGHRDECAEANVCHQLPGQRPEE